MLKVRNGNYYQQKLQNNYFQPKVLLLAQPLPKKPDYFEKLPLMCSCRTMCCCHRTCCCPTSCTCVCNFSSHCEKQARLVTRGVGSRLMLAMGWQVDQGLGREGQGRVEMVAAWFYPPGRGLGWRRSGGAGASCSSAPPPGGAGGGWVGGGFI